jgi:hypothetical protein
LWIASRRNWRNFEHAIKLASPSLVRRRWIMTTEIEAQRPAAQSQAPDDDVAASILAIEQAVLRPSPRGNREAIHQLGCRIVAEALKQNDNSR